MDARPSSQSWWRFTARQASVTCPSTLAQATDTATAATSALLSQSYTWADAVLYGWSAYHEAVSVSWPVVCNCCPCSTVALRVGQLVLRAVTPERFTLNCKDVSASVFGAPCWLWRIRTSDEVWQIMDGQDMCIGVPRPSTDSCILHWIIVLLPLAMESLCADLWYNACGIGTASCSWVKGPPCKADPRGLNWAAEENINTGLGIFS